ncbi:hypothetical protein [Microbacterium sp. SD291]|nr:hypothetical protein [Microbacterium sp. SD291]
MNDSIFTDEQQLLAVRPTDLQLPPTQPIDISELIRLEARR